MAKFNILPENLKCLQSKNLLPEIHVPISQDDLDLIEIVSFSGQQGIVVNNLKNYSVNFGQNLSAIERVNYQINELPELKKLQFLYLYGFDDGLYIRKVLKDLPASSRLLCVEVWPELFYKICEKEDVSDILKDNRFEFLLGRNPDFFEIKVVIRSVADYDHCNELRRSYAFRNPRYNYLENQKQLTKLIIENLQMKSTQKRTADKTVALYLNNAAKGLRHSDLAHVKNIIQGKPYVAVGLGPSLAYEVETLRRIQDKVIIGVADNALRELLDAGIDPDIVFQVEWRIEAMSFYDGLIFRKPAVLCFTQGVPQALLEWWPYKMIGYPSEYLNLLFRDIGYGNGWPGPIGSNVGDMVIQFGLMSCASEVYLVGMDFSCPAGSYHHPNTAAMREEYGETSRFWSPEKWDWRYVHGDLQRVETETWDGDLVYSHASFKQSVTVMNIFQNCKLKDQKIYSTSKYGSKINAEYCPLTSLCNAPNIIKVLDPKSPAIPKKTVLDIIEKRAQELKRYYRKLDQLQVAGRIFIESFGKNNPKAIDSTKQEYIKILDDFRSDMNLSWLEDFVLILDMGLSVRTVKRKMALMDEKDVILEKAKSYIEYIEEMKKYRSVIENFLKILEREFENEQ